LLSKNERKVDILSYWAMVKFECRNY